MGQFYGYGDAGNGSASALGSGVINTYAAFDAINVPAKDYRAVDTFNIGDWVILHQTQSGPGQLHGYWELNKIIAKHTISGGNASYTMQYPIQAYTTGSQMIKVPLYSGGNISGAITATAWDGSKGGIVALISDGTLTISGSITANGAGFRGGPGQTVDRHHGKQGEASEGCTWAAGGYTGESPSTYGNGGGGGGNAGGTRAAGGGGGGNGSAGAAGDSGGTGSWPGGGGDIKGEASLLSAAVFGGGGGSGGSSSVGAGHTTGVGGRGGGLVIIIAKKIIVTGSIQANATAGGNPTRDGLGGGGGGAGGSIVILSESAALGSGIVQAVGASGGAGAGPGPIPGGAGGTGRVAIHTPDISGNTNPGGAVYKGAFDRAGRQGILTG